jgi:hypothetical protein
LDGVMTLGGNLLVAWAEGSDDDAFHRVCSGERGVPNGWRTIRMGGQNR